MKRPIVLLLIVLALLQYDKRLHAQGQLWGVASEGGAYGMGVIFRTNADGSGYIPQHSFTSPSPGGNPWHTELTEYDGKLYGMTYNGGLHNLGVLFAYDPATGTYDRKIDFALNQNGGNPIGSLIVAANGKMYGCTQLGGGASSQGRGVVFEYNPVTNTCVNKFIFYDNDPHGEYPKGSLVLASNGKIYGTTWGGGAFFGGVLFEFDPATGVLTQKADFNGPVTGRRPGQRLMEANGKLYGVTTEGGANNQGVVYEFDLSTSALTKKADFALATTGGYPLGYLTRTNDGKLYGMTQTGGANSSGTLFEFDPSTSALTARFSFNQTGSGFAPEGSLLLAGNGNLYGMTTRSTTSGGTLFEFNPSTLVFTKKTDFGSATGFGPRGTLMQASNGKLYGMIISGGNGGRGIIFEYDITTNVLTKKVDLSAAPDGKQPVGKLLLASNGKMYGVTREGGAENKGVLFEYDPVTSTFTRKYDFRSTNGNGYGPESGLIQASNGKLYGTTVNGGGTSNSVGVLFEFDPVTDTYVKKIDFTGVNGNNPYSEVLQASNGKLYGVTRHGGATGFNGVLFEYDLSTGTYTKKFEFSGANGTMPWGRLFQASNGKLYGMTSQGGSGGGPNGYGILYEYDIASAAFTKRFDFDGLNGNYPSGNSVIEASNGKLYGVVTSGGTQASGNGVLFEFDKTTNTYTKKLHFSNGFYPSGHPVEAPNGNLYGMLAHGGNFGSYQGGGGYGVLYEYNPATSTYAVKHHFNGAGGAKPWNSAALLYVPQNYKSSQSITFDTSRKTYGDPDFVPATASSSLPVSLVSSNPAVATVTGNTLTIMGLGTTIITASQGGDAFFNPAPTVQYTLTVHKHVLVATAESKVRPYGDPNPPLTISYSGFKAGETPAVLDVLPVATTSALQFDNTGTYPINLSGGADGNYDLILINGTLTVAQATLTVTAADQTKIYGDANPPLTFSYSGFKGTETESVLNALPVASTAATHTSNAGTYPITLSGGSDNNYSFTLVNGVLTVNKAPLTITAEDKTRDFGVSNPPLTVHYSAFKGTDQPGDIDEHPVVSCAALPTSNTGTYPILLSGGTDNNYTLTLINGTLTVTKIPQTITFDPLPSKAYGDTPFTPTAASSSGLSLSFTSSNTSVATVSGNTITIVGVGTSDITASQPGDVNHNPAVSVMHTLTVVKGDQTISFDPLDDVEYGHAPIALNATASSGLTVSYTSSDPSIASVSGNMVTVVSPGIVTITASQPGNTLYNAATEVPRTLTVTKASQAITFGALAARQYNDPDFGLTATATSGLTVSFSSSNTSVAMVSGNTVTITGVGTTTITASQAGNTLYDAAPDVQQILTVDKDDQTITFGALPAKTYGDTPFSINATTSSGLAATFSSSNPSVATVSGSIVTIVGAGSTTITASQPGDALYNAAATVNQLLTVTKAAQNISFGPLTDKAYGDPSFTLSATSSSGLPVAFSSTNTAAATVSGNTVTIVGPGPVTIVASQAGDANHEAATNVNQSFNITLPAPTETASYVDVYEITSSAMTIEFFPGDGHKRIVIMKAGAPVSFTPVNNTSYAVGYTVNGNVVAMNDNGAFVTVTNLTPSTRYYIKIIEYNELGGFISYMTTSATATARTLASSPGFAARSASGQGAEDELEVSVLSNPFKTRLSIFIHTATEEDAIVGLMDLNGKTVHRSIGKTNRQIDIEEPMASGMYMLRVRTRSQSKVIRVVRSE